MKTERGRRSCVLGPLPSQISPRERRERDEVARLVRVLLENEDLACELSRARSPEEYS